MSQDTTDKAITPFEAARWHRVADDDLPQEGRVRSVVVDGQSIALSRCGGTYGALENRSPHQGGPLGVLAVRLSFSNHTRVADYMPIIQVDDSPQAVGRFHAVTTHVLGDAATTLAMLHDEVSAGGHGNATTSPRDGSSGGRRRLEGHEKTEGAASRWPRCSTAWVGTCRRMRSSA